MTSQGMNTSQPSNGHAVSSGKSIRRQSLSPLRQRPWGRASTLADVSYQPRDRRSSNLSDSIDSTRQSLKSSTDDLLLPRARSPAVLTTHEPSHWHSFPLALALLPAVGGLFFNNGSVILTDLTLLVLAAVFLNWAVRLPWDWYLSTQSVRTEEPQTAPYDFPPDTIIEEDGEEEDQGNQSAPAKGDIRESSPKPPVSSLVHASAVSELRSYEILALSACFVSPAIGAWLLHHIRSQLSRPSEGLVSNYNLTIFLLASELRPVAHLIKMVQARTLYLQRIVATNPHTQESGSVSPTTIHDLSARLADLETHVADNAPNSAPSKTPTAESIAQTRKSVQPDFDALNRAVRRYEKRATILSIQTESRLQELEKRVSDAITLAAAVERSSQTNKFSGIGAWVHWVTTMALLPIQIGQWILSLPSRLIGDIWGWVEGYVGQKIRREMKTAGKVDTRTGSGSEKRRVQGRGQKKAM